VTLLSVTELEVRYGPVTAIRSLSLSLAEGQLIGVVGPNGAGKSTLLLAIAGAVAATRGEIRFDGKSLADRAPEAIARSGISLVPEGRHIFGSLTVLENLQVGASARRDRSAARVEIAEMMALFPILAERRNSPAGRLSGGEQQMLAIARALLTRPRLLLLDEPSLGLGPMIVDQVYERLSALHRGGLSILLVEQNATRVLEMADRTYVLRSGEAVLSGTTDELLGDPDFDQAYFGVSMQETGADK
jgi:branched-chain amino acid transport system ATP-binding protein